jgi:hypothetical protein
MGGGCFTDAMLRSSIVYHQDQALSTPAEPRRLHKDNHAACGAVILPNHGHRAYIRSFHPVGEINPCYRGEYYGCE